MDALMKTLVLAVLQGLTEFLPVSSSGHLVIGKHLMSLESPGVFLEVSLHAGTLIAILLYYRRTVMDLIVSVVKLERSGLRYALNMTLGILPAVVLYVAAGDWIESVFDKAWLVPFFLIFTGIALLSLRLARRDDNDLKPLSSSFVGFAQALAMIPGISRSGMTLVCARHLGIKPEKAVEFSLLMSVPLLVGAVLLECIGADMSQAGDLTAGVLFAGVAVSACVGYGAILLLVRTLAQGRLWLFGFYCMALGLTTLLFMS